MTLRHALIIVVAVGAACSGACNNAYPYTGSGPACRDPLVTADGADSETGDGGIGRTCQPNEPVFICDVPNARDLVGTPIGNGQTVACGAIYRGAPLAGLSSDGCLAFATLGIKTVVDLRTVDEQVNRPDSACVAAAARVVSAPMPIPFYVSAADYVTDLNASASVAAAFATLGDAAAYPIYFHCTFGRDRTGVLAALVLSALGATRDEILREYLLSQATVGAAPASLIAVLDEIDRRGGIDVVLAAAGVPPEQVATLRSRALAP